MQSFTELSSFWPLFPPLAPSKATTAQLNLEAFSYGRGRRWGELAAEGEQQRSQKRGARAKNIFHAAQPLQPAFLFLPILQAG